MAISEYDYVKVGSGTEETYVPFDDSDGGYNVSAALDNINGEVITGGLESKTDYLEETKEQIKQAIVSKGGEVGDVFRDYANVIREIDTLSVKYTVDTDGKLSKLPIVMDFAGVEDIGDYALLCAYGYQDGVDGVVSFPDLLAVSGRSACDSAFINTNVTQVLMPKLEEISGNYCCSAMFSGAKVAGCDLGALRRIAGSCSSMFQGCPLVNIELPSLEEIYGQSVAGSMFRDTSITWPQIPKLTTIYGSAACEGMFRDCLYLNGAIFDSLSSITGQLACSQMFAGITSENAKTFSFPALRKVANTNAFSNMFKSDVNITVVFPKNMQSRIESLTGYSSTTPFGATSGAVGFYLPSTYLLKGDTVTYERNPIGDNGTNSAWRVLGTSPDSTSFWVRDGMQTDPIVGTAIYSDRECTVQVDTVAEITEEE